MKKKGILLIGGAIACIAVLTGTLIMLLKSDNGVTSEDDGPELIAPVMEWWDLYNPNGMNTITAVIRNDNNVAVDVSYDLVYYKNGNEVGRSEEFTNFGILGKGKDVVWANVGIPQADEVDEIKMENVMVAEAYKEAIDGKYEYLGVTDGEAMFRFQFDKKPALANIMFILYNDNNSNKKCDKGEIVVTSNDAIMEQTGEASFSTEGYDFTDFEVHFNAQGE